MTTRRAAEDPLGAVMFPVREVPLVAEPEPGGRLSRIPGSKAVLNERSGDVLAIV